MAVVWPVTQYPIPAITVPGRMRYSRHKRSEISCGCHNEPPPPPPGLLLAAISDLASLQVIPSVGFTVTAVCIGDLESAWVQMIALFYHRLPMDRLRQCKLMLVHTLNHLWQQSLSTSPPPQTFYANAIFPHTLDLLCQWARGYVYTQTLLTLFCYTDK